MSVSWTCRPLLAAEPPVAGTMHHTSRGEKKVSVAQPAQKCLSDLRAFDGQMGKSGYWLGGDGYGYGYPMSGYGTGYAMGGHPETTTYENARPGYEVRMLIASANILAQHGQQQQCEDVLATTRTVYKQYRADLHGRGVPMADVPGWRIRQIAAAEPVTSKTTSFRSDELLGTEVRDPQNLALGSVDDLVMKSEDGRDRLSGDRPRRNFRDR